MTFSTAKYAALFPAEAREHLSATATRCSRSSGRRRAGSRSRSRSTPSFRAVHTMKGMSATMGYAVVERVAHEMEHVMACVRDGARDVDGALVDALLDASDVLAAAVEAAVDDTPPPSVDAALAALRPTRSPARARPPQRRRPTCDPGARVALDDPLGAVRVHVRIDGTAALPGVRAFLALQRAQALGVLDRCSSPRRIASRRTASTARSASASCPRTRSTMRRSSAPSARRATSRRCEVVRASVPPDGAARGARASRRGAAQQRADAPAPRASCGSTPRGSTRCSTSRASW